MPLRSRRVERRQLGVPLSHIRHSRQGHDFKSVYRHRRRNHVVSRATPLHTAAEPPHAAHCPAQPARSRQGSPRQPPMDATAKSQTAHSKLDQMAPRATRPRRQHVEVDAQRHDDDLPSQRGQEGARQPSERRRRGPGHRAARSARPAISNCHVPAKGARAHDQARVKSELDDWGDEVRRAGTAYRAQTFLRAESARAARCFIAPAAGAPIC